MNNDITHYGVGHLQGGHSGRWPYGSKNNGKGPSINLYKNKDGSLNKLGQKKARKAAEKYAKITGKKLVVTNKDNPRNNKPENAVSKPEPSKKKSIGQMSISEMKQQIDYIETRNKLVKLMTPANKVEPKPGFIKSIKNRLTQQKDDVIWPAVTDSARSTLTNYLKNKGNELVNKMKNPSTYDVLKTKSQLSQYGKQIVENNYNRKITELKLDFLEKNAKKYETPESLKSAVNAYVQKISGENNNDKKNKKKIKNSVRNSDIQQYISNTSAIDFYKNIYLNSK